MLRSLKKLFAPERPGRPLFESVVAAARRPHWYARGGVADSVEGRFAVLATLAALVIVRLERGGDAAVKASVALTECLIDEMDGEVRQMGVGDPSIAKQVGAMVGALGRRTGRFRDVVADGGGWREAVEASLYRGALPDAPAQDHAVEAVRAFWSSLERADDAAIVAGQCG